MSLVFDTYPARQLSEPDAMRLMDGGPDLALFVPWAVLGELRTDRPNLMPYGVAHWYFDADGDPRRTVQTFLSEEDARWAMECLYRTHEEGCRCAAIFYWTPAMVNYGAEVTP